MEEEVSTLEHCLWQCSFFAGEREVQTPDDAMKRRLGWSFASTKEEIGSSGFKQRIKQMGKIREEEAKVRIKLFVRETAEAAAAPSIAASGRSASAANTEVGD